VDGELTEQIHLYRGETPPGTNAKPHLYRMVCTSWIPGTNESYQPVQMSVFPVVHVHHQNEKQKDRPRSIAAADPKGKSTIPP
jgi:hypothetical protein